MDAIERKEDVGHVLAVPISIRYKHTTACSVVHDIGVLRSTMLMNQANTARCDRTPDPLLILTLQAGSGVEVADRSRRVQELDAR